MVCYRLPNNVFVKSTWKLPEMPLVLPKLHKGRLMSQKYAYVVFIPHLLFFI